MTLQIWPIGYIPEVHPKDDLVDLLRAGIDRSALHIEARDIIAVTQKIISKAEGRIVHLNDITPSQTALSIAKPSKKDPRLVEVILSETKRIVRLRGDVLICETHHGFICANAGVDRSNVEAGDAVTLLPRDPDRSAWHLARQLGCGVIITDTFGRVWREGLLDLAIGIARVPVFIDFRGTTDTKGYSLQATNLAAVDALAAAAGLVMGKTSNTPAALVRGFGWEPVDQRIDSILRPAERDLFL
jgi:coenzyme F420-0:L-glutamate ligase/coenzyme F420-1:gamma-L-glutamate ligase